MSPFTLALLRRSTVYALALAALGLTLPPALRALGVLGPSLQEEVESSERAVLAARSYGARPEDEALARAEAALARAQAAAREGSRFRARRAAAEASSAAIEAQRLALARRDDQRRQAEKVVREVDRLLSETEDVYSEVTKTLDKAAVGRLISIMKGARQKVASLWLAFQEGNFARVIEEEQAARQTLLEARAELHAARSAPAR